MSGDVERPSADNWRSSDTSADDNLVDLWGKITTGDATDDAKPAVSPWDKSSTGDAKPAVSPWGKALTGAAAVGAATADDAATDDAKPAVSPWVKALIGAASGDDASTGDASGDDASTGDASDDDALTGDATGDDALTGDATGDDASTDAAESADNPSDVETASQDQPASGEGLTVNSEALRSQLVDDSPDPVQPEQDTNLLSRLGPIAAQSAATLGQSATSFGAWLGKERANRRSAREAAKQRAAAKQELQSQRPKAGGDAASLNNDTLIQEKRPDEIPWSSLDVWDRLDFGGNSNATKKKQGPGRLRQGLTLVATAAVLLLCAWLGLQYLASDSDLPGNEWAEDVAEDPPFPLNVAAAVFGTEEAPIAPPGTGPYVQLDWNGQQLVVGGLVPDVRLVEELLRTAEANFERPNVVSELVIDADLGTTPGWLAAAPDAIPTVQLLSDVTLIIADGRILVAGTARTADDIAFIDSLLVEATGMPVELRAVEISGQRAASWLVERSGNEVRITGALPTEELRAGFVAAAERLYTNDNVVDFTNVDDEAEIARWMSQPDDMFNAFYGFSKIDLEFSGEQYLFRLAGGPSFATGSAEIGPELTVALNWVADIMKSEPTMSIELAGHTDSTGSRATNQILSEARALAAANYLIRAGIAPDRVRSLGFGPDRPIDTNETDQGRESNRRIEMLIIRDPLGF